MKTENLKPDNLKVGFIGLGVMGFPMALNLLEKGYDVTGFNRSKPKEEKLASMGARRVDSLAKLGETCDVIVACLPDENAVKDAIFGEKGLMSGEHRFRYLIDCSTIDVTSAIETGAALKKEGIYYFDSPVSGGPGGATNGTLTFMVGGDEAAFADVEYVCRAMGENILYFGANGSGLKVKLVNQLLTWINHAVICEAAVLAKKAGIDEDKLYNCLKTSYGWSRILEVSYKSHIQPENYENPTGMAMMVKDLNLVRKFAAAFGAHIPMTDAAMSLYLRAMEDGCGNKDQSIIMEQLKT